MSAAWSNYIPLGSLTYGLQSASAPGKAVDSYGTSGSSNQKDNLLMEQVLREREIVDMVRSDWKTVHMLDNQNLAKLLEENAKLNRDLVRAESNLGYYHGRCKQLEQELDRRLRTCKNLKRQEQRARAIATTLQRPCSSRRSRSRSPRPSRTRSRSRNRNSRERRVADAPPLVPQSTMLEPGQIH